MSKEKMLSFLPDPGQTARMNKRVAEVEKELAAMGLKQRYHLSTFIRNAIDEKLDRDSKKKR